MHQNKNQNKTKQHQPVMSDEVMNLLGPQPGDSYLDLTAGYGGHASQVIAKTGKPETAVLVDRDQNAVAVLEKLFSPPLPLVLNQDFFTASKDLLEDHKQFELILADLGVSSPHLNEGKRGFSFAQEGPLDMRMDQRQSLTAEKILNSYSKIKLAELLSQFGEEPKANRIAELIVAKRPLASTAELADIASSVWKGYSRVHPATRTFQALRIAVNDELAQLEASLPLWLQLLKPDGRLVVISFHSLEDRIVKKFFQDNGGERYDADLRLLTKHPIRAGPNEIAHNPRARSAKLRAAVKINNKRKGATDANSGKKQIPSVQGRS